MIDFETGKTIKEIRETERIKKINEKKHNQQKKVITDYCSVTVGHSPKTGKYIRINSYSRLDIDSGLAIFVQADMKNPHFTIYDHVTDLLRRIDPKLITKNAGTSFTIRDKDLAELFPIGETTFLAKKGKINNRNYVDVSPDNNYEKIKELKEDERNETINTLDDIFTESNKTKTRKLISEVESEEIID